VTTNTALARLSVLATAGCLLAACSAGSSGAAASTAAHASGVGGSSAAAADPSGADSGVSIRVANVYETDSLQPGPGLDLYDVPLTGEAAKPLLTDIAYGSFSAYVHPHLLPNALTKIIQLAVLPTGEDPVADMKDAKGIGGLIDDGSRASCWPAPRSLTARTCTAAACT
jgi:hypothetical protein